ncbi:MAG TPA: terminase family protein, partial [Gammaproteobacteria bacterium]|nr:terminase family protein [Gammaproteobacteria bacterium]
MPEFQIRNRQDAAREYLRRRRARTSLVDYTRYTKRGYVPGDIHFEFSKILGRVISGECKRLMISVPPRHGKTEHASIRLPGLFFGHYPDRNIISAAYNSDRAGDVGREVRDLLASPEHRILFPEASLLPRSNARDRMHTVSGGAYFAGGVGSAMTGRGAHLLLIDDPYKNRVEADSLATQNRVYSWYLSTAYTRLER